MAPPNARFDADRPDDQAPANSGDGSRLNNTGYDPPNDNAASNPAGPERDTQQAAGDVDDARDAPPRTGEATERHGTGDTPTDTPTSDTPGSPDTMDIIPDGDTPGETADGAAAASVPPSDDAPTSAPSTGAAPNDPGDELDTDARWAQIVAELADLGTAPGSDEPGTRTSDHGRRARIRELFDAGPVGLDSAHTDSGAGAGRMAGPRDWPTSPDVEALEDEQSHFIPPEPPRVFGHDPLLTMAWVLAAGMPLLMLVVLVLARPYPTIVAQLGTAGFLVGLAVLLWRMPHKRDDDEGPGAVV